MIVMLALAAAAAGPSAKSQVGDWKIQCFNDGGAEDGLFDRCEMRKTVSGHNIKGVEFVAERDASGITITIHFSRCTDLANPPSATVPAALLSEPDADKKLIGAQFLAMNSLARQCPSARGIALSLGGSAEASDILAATSKIRMKP